MINQVGHRLLQSWKSFRGGNKTLFRTFSTTPGEYNMFHASITLNPHPDKRDKGGEDSACLSETFIALADGVGGWADSGVDPANYSRELCGNIHDLLA